MLLNKRRAQRLMQEVGLDAVIVTSPENVAYAADYFCLTQWINKGTPVFAVLPADDDLSPCLITLPLEFSAWAESPSWISDICLYGTSYSQIGIQRVTTPEMPQDQVIVQKCMSERSHGSWLEVLKEALADRQLLNAKLGLDESGLSYVARNMITNALSGAEVKDAANLMRQVRMIKTSQEIKMLRHASKITESALAETMTALRPGVSERELVNLYNRNVAALGGAASLTLITGGIRSGHPHAMTSDYIIKTGDMIKFDLGCTYQLYWSDTARARVLGKPTRQQERVHSALLTAEQAAIKAIRPGVRSSELFEIAVQTARESGIPDYQRHHVGHGIGIEVYEPPLVQRAGASSELSGLGAIDLPLEPGMVLNIECPYYIVGGWGLNVEDTVLVTTNGAEPLTQLERGLQN